MIIMITGATRLHDTDFTPESLKADIILTLIRIRETVSR